MTSITGTLVKITQDKKLMISLDPKQYDFCTQRVTFMTRKFDNPLKPTFDLVNDEGDQKCFIKITLDKYDKQDMSKYEKHLKEKITIFGNFKQYDFKGDEDKIIQGCSFMMSTVKFYPKKVEQPKLLEEYLKEQGVEDNETDISDP